MAYNTSKGPRKFGDLINEDDVDTHIDWNNDKILLRTNNLTRLQIENTILSSSVGIHAVGATSFGSSIKVTGSISGSSTLQAVGNTFLGGTLNVSGTTFAKAIKYTGAEISGSGNIQVVGAITAKGNMASSGSITAGTSFIIGSADMNEADLEKLDGITGGTAAANKAVVLDGSKNIATIGTIGCGAITTTGLMSSSAGLNIVGASNFGDNVRATGSISGSSTLQAVGNTILGGNLNVSGTTFATAIKYTGAEISGSGRIQVVGAVTAKGNMASSGSITAGTSFIIGSADMSEADLEKLDGITDGTAVANKAVVLDGSKNIATLGTIGCGAITTSGDLAASGDTNTFSSANSTDPVIIIKNTTNDAKSARLRFIKDKGAAGAANDEAGVIEFFADDASQDNICFASITGSVAVHTNGQEGGKITLKVASNDGEQQPGLVIVDGSAEDEVDVTIGNGADSLVTIAGDLDIPNGGFALGSDADGDIYYRNSGNLQRLAKGDDDQVLTLASGIPSWAAAGAPTTLSGTTAQLTTGVETSGYLKVTGSSTLAAITATAYSGSTTMQVVGNTILGGTLAVSGNADFDGTITCDDSITIDSITITDTEIGYLDGLTAGTAAATKAVVLDGSKNIATLGTVGCGAITSTGASTYGSLAGGAISGSSTLQNVGTITSIGNMASSGSITAGSSFVIGSADINETDLEKLDGITDGTAAANKAVVLDGSKNIATLGTVGCGAITSTGASTYGSLAGGAISGSSTFHAVGFSSFGAAVSATGSISGSSTLQAVGNTFLGGTLNVSGATTLVGDLTATADSVTFQSANADDPLVTIKNTTNDATGARLRFVKDKGGVGADGDDIGVIEFVGDDAAQTQTTFAKIVAEVSEADDTDEAGKLSFYVAESDGTTTTLTAGLVLEGEHATDGEVDVTIGAGATSLTTIAGDLDIPNGGFALGSDASGDMYYRNSSGVLTRIAAGSDNHVLTLDGAVPGWEASSGGTPTSLSGTTAQLTTGVETSGYLKVTGSTTLAGALSSSNSIYGAGAATFSSTVSATGSISGSSTLQAVGNTFLGGTLNVSGATSLFGDVTATADTVTFQSVNSTDPLVEIKNTTNDANGARLRFVKDKGGAGADNDVIGIVEFYGDDDGQNQTLFAKMEAAVADASNGTEGGKLSLGVATHDGEMQFGLILADGDAEDEIDVTIGSGATSITQVAGNLGVGTSTPKVAVDVHQDPGLLVNDTGGGEVMKRGAGTTTAGKLYYLHSGSGNWLAADADTPESGSNKMLAIALGSTPNSDGMLLRGFFDAHTYLTGAYNKGQTIYMSDAAGYISAYQPSGSGDTVRIVGHAIDNANVIYFNPSPDWIEL